jgi:hypothetical protein
MKCIYRVVPVVSFTQKSYVFFLFQVISQVAKNKMKRKLCKVRGRPKHLYISSVGLLKNKTSLKKYLILI